MSIFAAACMRVSAHTKTYKYLHTHTRTHAHMQTITEFMDRHMGLTSAYQRSNHGWQQAISPQAFQSIKTCPKCSVPITKIRRYGRVVKIAALDHSTQNYVVNSLNTIQAIRKELLTEVTTLSVVSRDANQSVLLYGRIEDKVTNAMREIADLQKTQHPVAELQGMHVSSVYYVLFAPGVCVPGLAPYQPRTSDNVGRKYHFKYVSLICSSHTQSKPRAWLIVPCKLESQNK
jgi:hypothetical protein